MKVRCACYFCPWNVALKLVKLSRPQLALRAKNLAFAATLDRVSIRMLRFRQCARLVARGRGGRGQGRSRAGVDGSNGHGSRALASTAGRRAAIAQRALDGLSFREVAVVSAPPRRVGRAHHGGGLSCAGRATNCVTRNIMTSNGSNPTKTAKN
jgi:hypothetical protein